MSSNNDDIKDLAKRTVTKAESLIQEWADARDTRDAASLNLRQFRAGKTLLNDARRRMLRDADLSLAAEKAEKDYRAVKSNVKQKVEKLIDSAKAEGNAALEAKFKVNPEDLDPNLKSLLDSGALSGDDYASLIGAHADNATAMRIILSAAEDYAAKNELARDSKLALALNDYTFNKSREVVSLKLDTVFAAITKCNCTDWFTAYGKITDAALSQL